MATDQLTYSGHLVATSCWCGIRVGIPQQLYDHAREDSSNKLYCPLGHVFVYRKSRGDEEREKRERAERQLALERSRRDQAEAAAREERERTAAARAEVTRTRKRAVAGACPCCDRSFVQLARHMATKHPDYLGVPELTAEITWWNLIDAVTEVVQRASEPLTPAMVHGRLVLAGRRYDTINKVRAALYNAERRDTPGIIRVAPSTWAAS